MQCDDITVWVLIQMEEQRNFYVLSKKSQIHMKTFRKHFCFTIWGFKSSILVAFFLLTKAQIRNLKKLNALSWRIPYAASPSLTTWHRWLDSLKHQTSTWGGHNMTWQHSSRCDPSYAQSCIENHGSNVLFMLQNIWENGGCSLPQSKCEITKHVTTGSAEVRSNGSSSWQWGLKGCAGQASHD